MKTATIFLLAVFFEITSSLSIFAFAQDASSGVFTPIAGNLNGATPYNHKYEQHKHKQHGHKPEQHKHKKYVYAKNATHLRLPSDERYASLSQADAHCPANTVEWASLGNSPLYHNSQSHWFGHTKHGAYACKAILDQAGFRAGK